MFMLVIAMAVLLLHSSRYYCHVYVVIAKLKNVIAKLKHKHERSNSGRPMPDPIGHRSRDDRSRVDRSRIMIGHGRSRIGQQVGRSATP